MNRPGLYSRRSANPLATAPQGQNLSDMMSGGQAVNELVWNRPRCCCFGQQRRTSGGSLRGQWKCRDRGPKRELGRTNTPLPHIKVEQSQPQSLRQLNDPGDLPGGVGLPTEHEYSLEASRDRRAMLK